MTIYVPCQFGVGVERPGAGLQPGPLLPGGLHECLDGDLCGEHQGRA